jgi:hypothetical protein
MIKRIIQILFISVLFSQLNITTAQHSKVRGINILKVDFLAPIAFQELGLAYERVLTSNLAGQLSFQIIDEGFSLNPAIKCYPFRSLPPDGFFISPFGRIMRGSISNNIGFGYGGLIGYQALIRRRLTVSGFVGPTYNGLAAYESWEIWGGINVGIII